MTESILEQSRRSRTHGIFGFLKRKIVIAFIVLALVGSAAWYYYDSQKPDETASAVKQSQARAEKGDIKIAIESDGKVVAEDGVDLSFSVSADTLEVTDVYVKVGAVVKKGDKIATVKADSLEKSVRTAYASYQSVLASYNEKLSGATEEDIIKSENSIKQAEISLEQAEDNLIKVKEDAADSVEDAEEAIDDAKADLSYDFRGDYQTAIDRAYDDLRSNLKTQMISAESLLKDSDEILGVDDRLTNDSFEETLAAQDRSSLSAAISSYVAAKKEYDSLEKTVASLSEASTHASIELAADKTSSLLATIEDHLYDMQSMLASSITSGGLSQSLLDSMKSDISSSRSGMSSKIASLDSALKKVEDANQDLIDYQDDYNESVADLKNAYDKAVKNLETVKTDNSRNIRDAERSIETKKLSLSEARQNLEELKKPISAAELASAKSQLTSAAVSLERAQDELANATLISPIDGEVSALNYKVGDTILKDASESVVSIINKETLFVEVNIEEADINKLEVGQKADAGFDALDGLKLQGEISFISMTSETSNSGIVTYLVRVVFDNPDEANVREGMTASIEFTTAGVSDVVFVPVDAVRNVNGKASVQLESGEWSPVTTGFTDGENVEIIAGLEAGARVVY